MIRIVAYAVMVPAAVVLAVGAHNMGHARMAGLFAAFGLGHLLTLLVVVLDLYRVDSTGVRVVLTPVVVAQAGLYVWIVVRRLWRGPGRPG